MRSANIGTLSLLVSAAVSLATLLSTGAHAALTISDKATENVTCSAGVCTATAKKALLNVTDLANLIASSPVTIQSGSQAQDIVFEAPFSWTSSNGLTLDADRSIRIDRSVSDSGPAKLAIRTKHGDLAFGKKGNVTFLSTANPLLINGTKYRLVSTLPELISAVAANPVGAYGLSKTYDASPDGTYTSAPVLEFGGKFEGLGNILSNVTIQAGSNRSVGIFGTADAGAIIENIRLINVNVSGYTESNIGTIVGHNLGTVRHANAVGQVTGADSTCSGGIVGFNDVDSRLLSSSTSVVVTLPDSGNGEVGGAAACNDGTLASVTATGPVTADYGTFTGGLVGENFSDGSIADSMASGEVRATSANAILGGLVGVNSGSIGSSHATGSVIDGLYAGGLVGSNNSGQITRAWASGNIVIYNQEEAGLGGGLVGQNTGDVSLSFASGPVSGGTTNAVLGGLVGDNSESIENSYATGLVKGERQGSVGGLIGVNFGGASYAYSIGKVTAKHPYYIGGFLGVDHAQQTFHSSYWDLNTSGIDDPSHGAGNVPNDPGITGLTDSQLKSGLPTGFDPKIWAQDAKINNGYPYLIDNPPSK